MNNLAELAWLNSFSMLMIGTVGILIYTISYLRKRIFNKRVLILILLIAYFIYTGIPYIRDYIERDIKYLRGTVINEETSTYKSIITVYSYTLQAENENKVIVYVSEQFYDALGMKSGEQYDVYYFANSHAVNNIEILYK